ncbi:acetyl-coenzyme A carboxylase carboxyl transferase subunit beta [Paenibacillus sp. J31TS4]|uniref:acetyl-CoA carboxylase, carboxyltransferase subunit beta n=1 Tax=Paenibacillus sp. J31TS4 TaxID=2807195 RepID=UPI001B0E0776|nr:acetyl-CoA carboxylase, carboxyltransferase subunit beta [Paenibacillus sp. J31TS4]GIP38250.1 acetyl-coenzyme A carboxylase carboxyl transferase subunit beta [Paenibacillus sp. J31TS4]
MLKDIFQKKKKYATIPSEKTKRDIPEGIANKCPRCGTIQFSMELDKNLKVCSSCGYHFILNGLERVRMTLDDGRLFEFDSDMISADPLGFPGYPEKIKKMREKTGSNDAVLTGEGTIGGFPVVVCVMSFEFFTGSLGSVVGEKIARAVEVAMQKKYPVIIFSTSGGARMQESILALMQMAKTSAVLGRFQENGGLYISVLTDPTLGGVSASFAMLGDYILAEPGTIIGFAGRRVIEQTIRQKLPDNFQTAEFNLAHGQLDRVVHRKEMRSTLTRILDMHTVKGVASDGR